MEGKVHLSEILLRWVHIKHFYFANTKLKLDLQNHQFTYLHFLIDYRIRMHWTLPAILTQVFNWKKFHLEVTDLCEMFCPYKYSTNNNNRIKVPNLKCKLLQFLWPGQKPLFNRKLGTSAQNQANSCSVSSDYVKGSMCGGMHDSCQHKWKCSWIKNSLHKELIIILLSIASLCLQIFHII